jgi:hypothetical protein
MRSQRYRARLAANREVIAVDVIEKREKLWLFKLGNVIAVQIRTVVVK